MIWFFMFYSFFFLSFKDYIFFSDFFIVQSSGIFMVSIFPLVLLLIFKFLFSNLKISDYNYHYFIFLLIVAMVNFCFLVSNPFLFLIFLEATVLPMSFLIFYFSKDKDKFSAVFFMMFINIFGSIPFMFYSSFLMSTFSFGKNFLTLYSNFFCNSFIIFFCYFLILLSKLPIFLLHFWLTKAHVSASGSCSMLLASLMLKLGSFGLFKFSFCFLLCSFFILNFILIFSVLGSFFLTLIMIRFFDIKYLVACSSIVHMSLMVPLIFHFDSISVCASLFMMTGHGLVSYFLFFLVTLVYELSLSRNFDLNKSLESIIKSMSLVIFLFIFLNLGVPPFLNFMSEFFFCVSLYFLSYLSLMIFCGIMVLSIFFVMFFMTKILFGKKVMLTVSDYSYNLIFFSKSFVFFLFFLVYLY